MLAIALAQGAGGCGDDQCGTSNRHQTALTKFVLKKSLSARFVAVFRP
jgi:hypothetical protein